MEQDKITRIAKLILRVGLPAAINLCLVQHHGEIVGEIIGFSFFTFVYLFLIGVFLILGVLLDAGAGIIKEKGWKIVYDTINILIPVLNIVLTIYIYSKHHDVTWSIILDNNEHLVYCGLIALVNIVVELLIRFFGKIDINKDFML